MSLYVTGDTHGDVISRFSFKRHPVLRNLTKDDIVIILGDFGIPWNHLTQEQDVYAAKWLDEKPWTTIALRGNHDNTDLLREMPRENQFGGEVRRLQVGDYTADHIFVVDVPTILTLESQKCLCIPGADSHDVWPIRNSFTGLNVIDKEKDPNWKSQIKDFKRRGYFYRIKGESWWPDESVDVYACDKLLENETEHFDFIFTHEAPALISRDYGFQPTHGETYLEILRRTMSFDSWFHGHLHRDFCHMSREDTRLMCMYQSIVQVS